MSLIDLKGPWNVDEAICKLEEKDATKHRRRPEDIGSCSTDQGVPAGWKGHVLRRITSLISREEEKKKIDRHCRE